MTKAGELSIDLSPAVDAFKRMGVSMEEAARGLKLFGKKLGAVQTQALLNLEKSRMNLDDPRRLAFCTVGEAFRLDDCCYLVIHRIKRGPSGDLFVCQRADDRAECTFSIDQEVLGCPLEFYDMVVEGKPYHEVFKRRDDGSFALLPEPVRPDPGVSKPKRKLTMLPRKE